MDERIRERAQRAIAEKVFPGCVIGVVRSSETRVFPIGNLRYRHRERSVAIQGMADKNSGLLHSVRNDADEPVCENTIYDLASITKSIPLASLALTFASENPPRFNLADKVVTYLPELHNDHDATIEDLLRYRVTGPRLSQLHLKTFEEIRTYVFEHGFDLPRRSLGEGGWAGAYTNLPAFLLGLVIERVTGEILPVLAHKHFFEPLGMNDTTFFPTVPDASNSTGRQKLMRQDNDIAPSEIIDGVEIRGIVHDESARVFAHTRRAVGHAGLFSTAPDLLKFLEALLNVGHRMSYIVEGAQKGLGWEVDREWMGASAKASASRGAAVFGKTGFTGTSILCDVEKGIGLVILSNRTYPHRPPDNSAINAFRTDIADTVFG